MPTFPRHHWAQASISSRRFSIASPLLYARSVASPTTWANAASAISRTKQIEKSWAPNGIVGLFVGLYKKDGRFFSLKSACYDDGALPSCAPLLLLRALRRIVEARVDRFFQACIGRVSS